MRLVKSPVKKLLAILIRQPVTSRFVQYLFDRNLNPPEFGLLAESKRNLINNLSQVIIKYYDPLVKHNIGGIQLALPFSHRLPFYLKHHPHYSTNTARIARCVKQKYPSLTFVDIGANIGDTAALLRREAEFPILCIEGDEVFFSVLVKNSSLFTEVHIVRAYLGEITATINATVIKDGGTAHLEEGADTQYNVSTQVLSDIIENETAFQRSKMIKIDTDGFEAKILRGAKEFLIAAKPVIFFEYDPFFLSQQGDDGISIVNYIQALGYHNLLVYDNLGNYMLSSPLDNLRLLEELTLYFSGRRGYLYCDICAFHAEDDDLFEAARQSEILFFKQAKGLSQRP